MQFVARMRDCSIEVSQRSPIILSVAGHRHGVHLPTRHLWAGLEPAFHGRTQIRSHSSLVSNGAVPQPPQKNGLQARCPATK